jgi:hypothetical protein
MSKAATEQGNIGGASIASPQHALLDHTRAGRRDHAVLRRSGHMTLFVTSSV